MNSRPNKKWQEEKMTIPVQKGFLKLKFPWFCTILLPTNQVRCKLTGHELPPRLSALETYTKGKKYQRLIKDIPNESPDFEEFKDFLVPSEKNR